MISPSDSEDESFINSVELVNDYDSSIILISDTDTSLDKIETKHNFAVNLETIFTETADLNINSIDKIEINHKMSLNISHALKIIPFFDGKITEIHKFCTCVEVLWSQIVDPKEKLLFMNILKTKLCNQAYEVVHYKNFDKWEDLKLALENKFLKRRSQGAVSAELVCIVQNKSESIKSYSSKVENLLNELNDICISKHGLEHADIIKKVNESTALNSFQDGLKDNLKIIIKSHHFDNLNDAIAQAIEEEISHKPLQNNSYSNIVCSFCHKSGHRIDNCFKRNRNFNNGNPIQSNTSRSYEKQYSNLEPVQSQNPNHSFHPKIYQNNSNYNANSTCNYCKRVGHNISECYKRKFNASKQQGQTSSNVQVINQSHAPENQIGSEESNTAVRIQNLH